MINLLEFGTDNLNYANQKNCYKNFLKKFNEFFELPEDNNSATEKELIIFSLQSSKKELKQWGFEKVKSILGDISLTEEERETIDISNFQPKVIRDIELEGIINDD